MSVRRRIPLPITAETDEIVRISRRLDQVVARLNQQMDRLPLTKARMDLEKTATHDTKPEGEANDDHGPDHSPEEGHGESDGGG